MGGKSSQVHLVVRQAGAAPTYTAKARYESDLRPHVAHLLTETNATDDATVQAGVAGLIALKRFNELSAVLPKEGSHCPKIYSDAGPGRNWELIRLLIENWQEIERLHGPEAWRLLADWDILVAAMAQAGKRSLALKVLSNLRNEVRSRVLQDEDLFRAFAVLEQGENAFRELCITSFEKPVPVPGQRHVSWGYSEVRVIIAAGHYLADHHAGDAGLGRRLEEIAKVLREPIGPVIALCRGWPNSDVLQKMWDQAKGETPWNTSPLAAWLVGLKASAPQFIEYVKSAPREMQRRSVWSFPQETTSDDTA